MTWFTKQNLTKKRQIESLSQRKNWPILSIAISVSKNCIFYFLSTSTRVFSCYVFHRCSPVDKCENLLLSPSLLMAAKESHPHHRKNLSI